jgi:hypothetical protein
MDAQPPLQQPPGKRAADGSPKGQSGSKRQAVVEPPPVAAHVQTQTPVIPVPDTPALPGTVTLENASPQPSADDVLNGIAEFTRAKEDFVNALDDTLNNTIQAWRSGSPALFQQLNVMQECARILQEMKAQLPKVEPQNEPTAILLTLPQQTDRMVLDDQDSASTVEQPMDGLKEEIQNEEPVRQDFDQKPARDVISAVGELSCTNNAIAAYKVICVAINMKQAELAAKLAGKLKSRIPAITPSEKYLGEFKFRYEKSVWSCAVTKSNVIIQKITLPSDGELCSTWWDKAKHSDVIIFGSGIAQTEIAAFCGYATTSSITAVQNWLRQGKDYKITLDKGTAKFTITFSTLIRLDGRSTPGHILVGESAGVGAIKIIAYTKPAARDDLSATATTPARQQPSLEQRTLAGYYQQFLNLKLRVLPGHGDKHLLTDKPGDQEINNTIADSPDWPGYDDMCKNLVAYAHFNRVNFSIVTDSRYTWKAILNVGRNSTIMVGTDGAIFHAGPNVGERQPPLEDTTYKRI